MCFILKSTVIKTNQEKNQFYQYLLKIQIKLTVYTSPNTLFYCILYLK
jgi:hypothetical protein